MANNKLRNYDKVLAWIFGLMILFFLILAFTNETFFNWAYDRHQNQLSWYIRPLFLIPYCYFAYKKSWAGILGTMFALLTSMFWFPEPEVVSEQVQQFLEMEKEYLTGNWNIGKILLSSLVPVSLAALAIAFWERSIWIGVSVLIFIAVAKMTWSVVFGGEAGKSIFVPAILGLAICIAFVYIGYKKMEKNRE